ncbi:diaminobutyrate--2-oxoglutarate transaminase [Glaciibacter psychrotolerans]|uniref:Diaminobutyrate--2-oxoglutarate transaminase n=1 Tax=Glaciibacter psychrotolerans TaxID=670054 RepID=A0A7Z0J590_9MICO|nr:diaminobutyrate--2-oxoglutarate transaminase [Leifsonia psychrotolerans]NYJ18668.1 diaminobutyrate-2-oxoglutarate transaminase [Leifsonia psychrotolerans]
MDLDIFSDIESEVRGYIRSFPVIFDRAIGSIMIDQDGTEYIDFFSGAGALNYGHNNPIMKTALIEYIENDSISHSLDMATVAKKRFLETMKRVILEPRGLDYKLQFTGPTGTNAVEAALKIARLSTGRSTVVAFTRAFHGVSGGSLAATANQHFRQAAGYTLDNVVFMPFEGYFGPELDTIAYLEQMLSDQSSGLELPAAVILETIQAEGGVNVASSTWLRALRELCTRHGILLIVDDIQAGAGRSGEFFSFEASGIVPDIVTLSKSLSGYGLPMSLVLMKRDLDIWKPGAHSGTFRGNNMAFVCATTALETYWADDALTTDVHRKEAHVRERLEAIAAKYPQAELEVRGRGFIFGFASTAMPELARTVSKEAFSRGLIVETAGPSDEVLKMLPALIIDDATLTRGLDILAASFDAAIAKS